MPILLFSSRGLCMFVVAGSSLCIHTRVRCRNTTAQTHTHKQSTKNIFQSCFQATKCGYDSQRELFWFNCVNNYHKNEAQQPRHADSRLTCSVVTSAFHPSTLAQMYICFLVHAKFIGAPASLGQGSSIKLQHAPLKDIFPKQCIYIHDQCHIYGTYKIVRID